VAYPVYFTSDHRCQTEPVGRRARLLSWRRLVRAYSPARGEVFHRGFTFRNNCTCFFFLNWQSGRTVLTLRFLADFLFQGDTTFSVASFSTVTIARWRLPRLERGSIGGPGIRSAGFRGRFPHEGLCNSHLLRLIVCRRVCLLEIAGVRSC
jgi:hypothetical protein